MEFGTLEKQELVDPRHVNSPFTYLPGRSIGLLPNSNLNPQVGQFTPPPPAGVLGFRRNPDVILRMEMERSMSLFQMMADEGLVPSPYEEMKRKNAIHKLKKIVREWVKTVAYHHALPKRYLRFASGTILTYGSYGLGVHNSESDIDALCVGPCFATIEEDFFIVLHSMLARRPEVSDIHCVKGAKVPLMRFKFDGISIDLPYARLKVISVPEEVDVFNPFFLKNIDDTSWKSLSGVRANRRILQLVPNVEIFQAVLHCVKLWAKKRGVYGNLLGFFGGIHLALLSAFICQRHPTASLSALIFIFFKTFAFWPWPTPIVLQDGVAWPFIPSDKVLWMPIQLPCSPYEFCHSNVVRSTFLRIKNEFMRGHMLTKDMLRPDFDWNNVFESFPYPRKYGKFVKIFLSASDKDELGDWVGCVKSRFRCLIIKVYDHRDDELHNFMDNHSWVFILVHGDDFLSNHCVRFMMILRSRDFLLINFVNGNLDIMFKHRGEEIIDCMAEIMLEEFLGFCDPNPTEYVDVDASEPNAVFYWGLPPARTDMIDIGHMEEEFLKSTNNVYQGPTGKMKLSIVQADQLPQKAHFDSDRQSAKPCWRIVRSNQRIVPAYYKYQPIYVDGY